MVKNRIRRNLHKHDFTFRLSSIRTTKARILKAADPEVVTEGAVNEYTENWDSRFIAASVNFKQAAWRNLSEDSNLHERNAVFTVESLTRIQLCAA